MITNKTTTLKDYISAWRKCERKRNKIGFHQTAFAENIGHELYELLKPIIPDIDWSVGDYDECGYEVHLESRAIEADRENPEREYCLQTLIEHYFPELCFIVETESELRLTAKEADRVIAALEKLRRKEYLK
jgi:hypothetical protein